MAVKLKMWFCLLLSSAGWSQSQPNWAVKLNAVQLIDILSFPTLQVAVEKSVNHYSSVQLELGYQIYSVREKTDTVFNKSNGYKASLEWRIYLLRLINKRKLPRQNELFVGLQGFYRRNQYDNSIDYRSKTAQAFYRDDYGVTKTSSGINLAIGNQISVSNSFLVEPFLSVGFFNRKFDYNNLQYDESKHLINTEGQGLVAINEDLREDNLSNNLNFGFGFRIGYKF